MTISMLLLSVFTFVELNCENLFDCVHDSLKNDTEFLPDGSYHWTRTKYWRKLNRVGQTIVSCGRDHYVSDEANQNDGIVEYVWRFPDMIALCEVENDSVMRDLTKRSLLRTARYEYVMTNSPDKRGIDVAIMYSPFSFRLINSRSVRISPVKGMQPTRDLLYVSGLLISSDTLHVIAAHLPSRRGGEMASRPFRNVVAREICRLTDSIRTVSPDAMIVVAGDFNDYSESESVRQVCSNGFVDVSADAVGRHGAKATYKYRGEWRSLDHILVSLNIREKVALCRVHDDKFLLVEDKKYGGVQPRRNYLGPRWLDGFSDHLPLVAEFEF